ncbi:response regulator [Candidatus Riflebacteria bacterium]
MKKREGGIREGRILLVDDDPINIMALKKMLVEKYILEEAVNGKEAFAKLDEFKPDLILLDIMMPQMNGIEFCKKLRASSEHRFRKIIVVSGKAMLEERLEAYEAGTDDYLVKPFEEYELLAKVEVFLRLRHMEELNRIKDELNRELEERNREMAQFTYAVSHDLKSPLVTIKGFLDLLEEDIENRETTKIKDDIKEINIAIESMQRLLKELLQLSGAGKLKSRIEKVDLGELVAEAVSLVAGQIRRKGVRVEISPTLPAIYGDRQRLLQVFQNLIDNAVKYCGAQKNPLIEIGLNNKGRERFFFVRDNGMGIQPAFQEKIFSLFERLSSDSEGAGLGLPLVKRIVEAHGGRIKVESKGTGKGTVFSFNLPQKEEIV